MTDPLGQSQVLPYLKGLSADAEITLVSCEKKERLLQNKNSIEKIIANSGIPWLPLVYTKSPPVLSTLWDIFKMRAKIFELHKKNKFHIVHCRSYIASLLGLEMKKK